MRNVLKAETLERKFPLLSVENGCIVSKDADLTVAFEVELPELYTVTADEYEAMHASWIKAIKVLPEHSVVCKQDWFVKETYRPKTGGEEQSFLARSYGRHFNERPFLNHRCYLYLTKTTRERNRRQSDFSTLCRGFLLPREITDKETAERFLEAVEQFERIMNDPARKAAPPGYGRGDRDERTSRTGGEVFLPLAGGRDRCAAGHLPQTRADAYR